MHVSSTILLKSHGESHFCVHCIKPFKAWFALTATSVHENHKAVKAASLLEFQVFVQLSSAEAIPWNFLRRFLELIEKLKKACQIIMCHINYFVQYSKLK